MDEKMLQLIARDRMLLFFLSAPTRRRRMRRDASETSESSRVI